MKIAFLGAGAIGGYFGSLLSNDGHEVAYVARGRTLEILREQGLKIEGLSSETLVYPVQAAQSFAEAAELLGGLDVVILATKAVPGNNSFDDELGTLRSLSLQEVPVITTHNSVEVHHLAAQYFGHERTLAGVVRTYAQRLGPAHLRINPGPLSFNFGLLPDAYAPSGELSPRASHTLEVAQQLADALRAAGFRSSVDSNIAADIWSKAMYVTTTGALGALARQPLGYLRGPLRAQLRGLMEEVYEVGQAHNVGLAAGVVEQTLGFADKMPAASTSSMHRDIVEGLPNELDAQSGAIRRMGDAAGVETPLFDMVHECIVAASNPKA